MGYKTVNLICSAWNRLVLIVKPLQFHYSVKGPIRPTDRRGNSTTEWWSSLSKLSAVNNWLLLLASVAFTLTALFAFGIWVVGKQLVVLQERQNQEQEQRNRDQEQRNQQMERDNLTLQLKVEEERAARLRIEERFSPRTIAHEQAKSLQEHLSGLNGKQLTVSAMAGNAEAFDFADQLIKIFSDAGLQVTFDGGKQFRFPVPGFQLKTSADRTKDATALQKALVDSGLQQGWINREHSGDPQTLELFVGPKQ
jgi:hypothetical protein